jgi:hypothetical protein
MSDRSKADVLFMMTPVELFLLQPGRVSIERSPGKPSPAGAYFSLSLNLGCIDVIYLSIRVRGVPLSRAALNPRSPDQPMSGLF